MPALRGGASLSMQSRNACISPAFARSIALRVRASASPSNNSSMAIVVALRAPLGRPLGLPDCPGLNGFSVFRLFFQVLRSRNLL
jgi:hypothetical protein